MRGSVVRRGKTYSVVLDIGEDPQTGKRRQKWHSGFRTKREAQTALAELIGNVNAGTYVARTKQTVDVFAVEWLAAIEPTIRPATHYSYARNPRLHVIPDLCSVPMVAVDAGMLNGLYARLRANGRKDSAGGGLSPRSVRYLHTIVHRMFKDAVRWGRLVRNPCDAADPPRSTPSDSPPSSPSGCVSSGCRGSGCTTYATGGRRWHSRPASIQRSCRSVSATQISVSPSTPTATCRRGFTRMQLNVCHGSSSRRDRQFRSGIHSTTVVQIHRVDVVLGFKPQRPQYSTGDSIDDDPVLTDE
jgi:hypothetical protein